MPKKTVSYMLFYRYKGGQSKASGKTLVEQLIQILILVGFSWENNGVCYTQPNKIIDKKGDVFNNCKEKEIR